jgi:8-hydroxy-5-deazaflavin:NADPH oxidoreductase
MYNNTIKIGVLGSGIVGRVLANAFLQEGHPVMMGTRDIDKEEVVKWKTDNPAGKVGSFAETAAFGEILVLAVSGAVVKDVLLLAGKENFAGKLVMDATNPIASEAPVNGVLKFFTTMEESLMEQIQHMVPDAKLVKAFSCVGNHFMYRPQFEEGTPTMFICGNDEDAKKTTEEILEQFGWETADMGKIEASRAIEPLCMLWCIPGFLKNQWQHAFKLLKK